MKVITKWFLSFALLCIAGVVNAEAWQTLPATAWVHEWRTMEAQTDGEALFDDAEGAYKVFCRSAEQAAAAGNATKTNGDPLAEDYSNFADWDSQFFITFGEANALKDGDKIKVTMSVKADVAATVSTQSHGAPGAYIHWAAIGDVSFTTGWTDFNSGELEVGNAPKAGTYTIAFNLAKKVENNYYFKDIKVEVLRAPEVANWKDLIINGNMEGTDTQCFFVTEQGLGGPFQAITTPGIGKDGSKAVKVQSADDPAQDWDSQFFIRLPYQVPAGTKFKLSFDYKADKAGDFDTQSHAEPGGYIHWACAGSGSFTTEWQTYEKEGTVPAECDGSSAQKTFQTIAFNLAKNRVATEFIFDNVKFEVPEDAAIVENPKNDAVPYPVPEPTAPLAEGELIPDFFSICDEGGIPYGYNVKFGNEDRAYPNTYTGGARIFAFGEGGDFTRALYFREGYVQYGDVKKLALEAGKKYIVHFNSAMWKSSGADMTFLIYKEGDLENAVLTQTIANTPDVNGSKDAVTGSTYSEIEFTPEADGNYILKWDASGWKEVLLANPGVKVAAATPAEMVAFDWVAAEQGYTNQQDLNDVAIALDAKTTMTCSKGTGSTTPKYYTSGSAVRTYGGNTITFAGEGITKIVITGVSGKVAELTANTGELTTEGIVTTWKGEANEIVLTNNTSNQQHIAKLHIVYGGVEADVEPVHIANTIDDPYTVAKAVELIDAGDALDETVFVKGIISKIETVNEEQDFITYWISDNGSEEGQQFECYKGKTMEDLALADIEVGAEVIVTGKLTKYNTIYEFSAGNAIAAYVAPAKPAVIAEGKYYIFNPAANGFIVGANNWGTRASISQTGGIEFEAVLADGKYELKSAPLYVGKHLGFNGYVDNGDLSNWTIAPVEGQEGVFTLSTDEGNVLFWDGGEATTTSVGAMPETAANAYWQFISAEDRLASLATATAANPVDATFLILNNDFGRASNKALWEGDDFSIGGGDHVNNNAEKWGGNSQTFDVHQQIALPNGVYKLTWSGFYRYNNTNENTNDVAAAAHAEGTEVINSFVYANDKDFELTSIADEASVELNGGMPFSQADAAAAFAKGAYEKTVNIIIDAETLLLGVKKTQHMGTDWTVWDNFRLSYLGKAASEAELAALAEEIAIASSLGVDVTPYENVFTSAEAVAAVEALKVAEYNQVNADYPVNAAVLIPDFADWTGNMVSNQGQHWDGTGTSVYYEQTGAQWGQSAWTNNKTTTVKLPKGKYVLYAAGRASSGTACTAYLKVGDVTRYYTSKGDVGLGVATDGTASFDPEASYANGGKGRGFEYRYIAFEVTNEDGEEIAIEVGGEATAVHQWMSFTAPVLLTTDDNIGIMIPVLTGKITAAKAELEAAQGTVGDGLFMKPQAAYDDYAAAVADAEALLEGELTADAIMAAIAAIDAKAEAFAAAPVNAPEAGATYSFQLRLDGETPLYMSLAEGGITIEEEATLLQFVENEAAAGQYYLANPDKTFYVGLAGGNAWTMSTLPDQKAAWTFTALPDGAYRINNLVTTGRFVGTNANDKAAGSPCYADKKTDNGNVDWIITKEVLVNDDDPEITVPEGKVNLIANGNLATDDVTSFVAKEAPSADIVGATIVPGAGKNNSRGIVVKSADDPAQAWDTQFWISLNEELPVGAKLHVEFDYAANKAAKASTQTHAAPGNYKGGFKGDINFTTEWQKYSVDYDVTAAGIQSIALNLAEEKTATEYYFDNFGVWYEAPIPVEEWTDLIVNGNMEGESMECFYVTEQGVGGPFVAVATEGIGKDGSKAVKVQSADDPAQDWDSQFFIRLPYQLPAGTKYKVSFDYKADKAGDFDTQAHTEPGSYIHWAMIGSGSFTTDWQTFSAEGAITADQSKEGQIMQTIAFNLAKNKVATEFIFDNVKFEVPADIVSTLTKNPAVDPQPYPEPDGISTLKNQKNVEGMYNLNGQKVNKAQKGLYIMNGKKVVVK